MIKQGRSPSSSEPMDRPKHSNPYAAPAIDTSLAASKRQHGWLTKALVIVSIGCLAIGWTTLILAVNIGLYDYLGRWSGIAYRLTGFLYLWCIIIGSFATCLAAYIAGSRVRVLLLIVLVLYAPLGYRVAVWVLVNACR
jgi:hypothetical protein